MLFQSSTDTNKAIDPTGDAAKWSFSPYKKKLKTESLFDYCNSKILSKSIYQTQKLELNSNYLPTKQEIDKIYCLSEIPNLNIIPSLNNSKINKKQKGLKLNFKRSPRDLNSKTLSENLTQKLKITRDSLSNVNTKKAIQENSKDNNILME